VRRCHLNNACERLRLVTMVHEALNDISDVQTLRATVVDKLQVIALANEALHQVRRAEVKQEVELKGCCWGTLKYGRTGRSYAAPAPDSTAVRPARSFFGGSKPGGY